VNIFINSDTITVVLDIIFVIMLLIAFNFAELS